LKVCCYFDVLLLLLMFVDSLKILLIMSVDSTGRLANTASMSRMCDDTALIDSGAADWFSLFEGGMATRDPPSAFSKIP